MTPPTQPHDDICINTIRTLSMDAVQKANSGHPGTPMGLAPLGYVLWTRYLRHSPTEPHWPDRDRFVLSAGHASMLLYSLLHLTGYDLSLDELKRFRQWGSRTPGHPEHGLVPGAETTTGPLGQGFANGVGMAIAERYLAAMFNRPGHTIVDHDIYAICSDGDLMEGVASEAASLAGHLGLGNLIYFYDENRITIEGDTALAFSEDVAQRFQAYGWHVQRIEDGTLTHVIGKAIEAARAEKNRPSLIILRTHIAHGSPNKHDTAEAHGSPLGEEEIRLTKKNLGWPENETFHVPEEALGVFRQCVERGRQMAAEWRKRFDRYAEAFPDLADQWRRVMERRLPDGWEKALPVFQPKDGAMATRQASGKVINAVAPVLPELLGGSADLAPSTNTLIKNSGDFERGAYQNRNLRFGIREHAMGGILTGMLLHGGVRPYGATFLIFSDYMRPSIRLAALMKQPAIYVFTHDSIGLGEDGPTHQPIEHLPSLRAVPRLRVIRPCDANETAVAWKVALEWTHGPTAIVLTRQGLPILDRTIYALAEGLEQGGYVLADAEKAALRVILIATGSEVSLVLEARTRLAEKGIGVRVVSMPCCELFDSQAKEYRDTVLPPSVRVRVAVEASYPLGWERYVGDEGEIIGIRTFGASAPAKTLFKEYGFTPEHVVARVQALLGT